MTNMIEQQHSPRFNGVSASTLSNTKFWVLNYFSALPCCWQSLLTLSPLLFSNFLLLVGFGLKRNQTTKSFRILPKIWRGERRLSDHERGQLWMNQFGEICIDHSQAFLVLSLDLDARKGSMHLWPPAKSLGTGPLFFNLLLFNQSFVTPTPCCVFTSVLLLFHLYWASNSWDPVVPSIVCSNPYLLNTYENQCRGRVWLFTSCAELSILSATIMKAAQK